MNPYSTYSSTSSEFDFITVNTNRKYAPLYEDCYQSAGWVRIDSPQTIDYTPGLNPKAIPVTLEFKRPRNIDNKSELQRTQNHCEDGIRAIIQLEDKKEGAPVIAALLASVPCILVGGFLVALSVNFNMHTAVTVLLAAVAVLLAVIVPVSVHKKNQQKTNSRMLAEVNNGYNEFTRRCDELRALAQTKNADA